MLKVTDKFLDKWGACRRARDWIEAQGTRDFAALYEAAKRDQHLDWVNWYVARKLRKRDRIRYAIYAARLVLPIYEATYPDDKRPRKAIEDAMNFSEAGNVAAARAAASAAAADADAAAAWVGAEAAARAAAAAAARAVTAAWNAARAADGDTTMLQIIDYGIGLLSRRQKGDADA